MAMIDEAVFAAGRTTPDTITREDIIHAIGRQAWGWYEAHKNDSIIGPEVVELVCREAMEWCDAHASETVLKRKVVLWTVTIKVRDVKPFIAKICQIVGPRVSVNVGDLKMLFEKLFGPQPQRIA